MQRAFLASILALALAGCGPEQAPPTQTPDSILRDFGYTVRVPPSKLHGPGSLVFRRNAPGVGDGKVVLGDICSPAFISFPETLAASSAESIGFGRSQEFDFGLSNFQALGLGVSANAVDRLTMRFDNTEVLEYSLQDLEAIRAALGPECTKLLNRQIDVGNAYQVAGVFKADLAYDIAYRAGASAEARLAARRELGGRFGVDFQGAENTVGTGLYYGLYLCDAECELSSSVPPG